MVSPKDAVPIPCFDPVVVCRTVMAGLESKDGKFAVLLKDTRHHPDGACPVISASLGNSSSTDWLDNWPFRPHEGVKLEPSLLEAISTVSADDAVRQLVDRMRQLAAAFREAATQLRQHALWLQNSALAEVANLHLQDIKEEAKE